MSKEKRVRKEGEGEQTSLAETDDKQILARLSERVDKAIATIKSLRRERDSLRKRLDETERALREKEEDAGRFANLDSERKQFETERGEIRIRIERILSHLETLDEVADDGVSAE
ncbi:MAG TPA: hypothetical protein VMT00_16000 [Thermoanaerobaculia bacterium]|nr:hypothetical protein [Thermoanaerobaculia bacterium]